METQEVFERFSIIANLSIEEIAPWLPVCEEAEEEIRAHLRENIDEEKHSRRLSCAAAALAFYRYMLCKGCAADSNTKIAVQMAYNIWIEARNSACDLLNDEDFVFERAESCGCHCKILH